MKAKEAKCALLGGHTIRNPEPIYGLSVTGLVAPNRMLTNAAANPGDLLVLTKPLGTGIITTGIKRGKTSPALTRRAVKLMSTLNLVGADLAEKTLVRAAVDVTGFGLLGHLASMCRASGVGAEIQAGAVPAIANEVWELIDADCVPGGTHQNLKTAEAVCEWNGVSEAQKLLLADAQTSGGLLLCVAPRRLDAVLKMLRRARTPSAAVIGKIVRSAKPRILVSG